jgi:hypothetical protein
VPLRGVVTTKGEEYVIIINYYSFSGSGCFITFN